MLPMQGACVHSWLGNSILHATSKSPHAATKDPAYCSTVKKSPTIFCFFPSKDTVAFSSEGIDKSQGWSRHCIEKKGITIKNFFLILLEYS